MKVNSVLPVNLTIAMVQNDSHAYEFLSQISGAVVEISESKSSQGHRIAQISGTAEQKRTAENLIQAFMMAT